MKNRLIREGKVKKSLIFSSLLCCVLFLVVSISNSTYSLDLAPNEKCPKDFLEVARDEVNYKCYRQINNVDNADEFANFKNYCEKNLNGKYTSTSNGNGEITATCYTNKVTTDGGGSTKTVTLNANHGTFWNDQTSSGTTTVSIEAVYDANSMMYKLELTYDTGKYSLQRSGYKFKGWSNMAGTDGLCDVTVLPGGSVEGPASVYYACWEKEVYNIGFNPNGGALKSNNPMYSHIDGRTTEWISGARDFELSWVSATRTGYYFMGWDQNLNCSSPKKSEYIVLTRDILYYACWEKNSSGGGNTGGGNNKPVITCSATSIGLWCTDANTDGGVTDLQTKLKYLDYYTEGEIDGKVGPLTVNAIKKFQQDEGITVDGNAGPVTLERLRLRYNEKIQENNDEETPPDEEEIPVNPLTYYILKYDTNGGTFANGETVRTISVSNETIIEAPPYNPTRDGYKFDGWYTSSGQAFTFYKSLTSDTTLSAKWSKINDNNCTYSCNSGDVFDPSTNKCISIQKFDNDRNLLSVVNYTKVCSNGTSWYSNYSCTGNCNKNDCSSGYMTNFWYEKNECHFGDSCSDGSSSSCSITMKKECYKVYEANVDCDEDNNSSGNNEDVNNNPPTGNILIVIVWVVGISALIYAIYYYNKNKKLN